MDRKITDAVTRGLESYYGIISASDVVQAFGGDKAALARSLAGIALDGPLPRAGTPERTAYNSANRTLGRYLAYESGSSKQARNPQNKAAQTKLRQALVTKQKPTGMTITITGEIAVSEDVRDRSVTIDSDKYPIDVPAFIDYVQQDNELGAYAEVFDSYCRAMHVNALDDMDIVFE